MGVCVRVLPMGFSPRQVHYGFNVTKEMTVEHSWGERVISNFSPMVAGQSLESRPLRAHLHAEGRSLPLGLSACTAILWASAQSSHIAILWASVLSAATTPALQPCLRITQSTGQGSLSLYRVNNDALPIRV